MTELVIQRGVPIPPRPGNRAGRRRYPFPDMQPGDSIFVAGARAAHLHHTAKRATKGKGWTFTTRTVVEGGEIGARCWRVS